MTILRRATWCACIVIGLAGHAAAGPIEDLGARLVGRTGKAELDHRQQGVALRVFGHDIKGGCKGDVRSAEVKLTQASGHLAGDTAQMDVAYEGQYKIMPCGTMDAPQPKRIFGHYIFHITSKPFQKMEVAPGDLAPGFGEDPGREDESNRLALEALKSAVAGAF